MHLNSDLVIRLKNAVLAGDHERQDELTEQFSEYAEHVQEVCRLLHHTSTTETLQISSKNTETSLQVYGSQLVSASHTLALHPNSKIAKENLEVFAEVWHSLVSDVAQLSREVSELLRGCPLESSIYTSLPKARTSSSVTAQLKTPPSASSQSLSNLNTNLNINAAQQTQSKTSKQLESEESVKSGHIKTSSDMDIEAEKWSQSATADTEDNDIARKAKSMSTMAISMYQFTRGEGELKTTQDLFTQAEFFADEANKLYKIVRHFTYQVINLLLLLLLEEEIE